MKKNSESVRRFVRVYDQYTSDVLARPKELAINGESTVATESVRPVNCNVFVDGEFLDPSIALGFIDVANDYNSVADEQVRKFLDGRCKEFKELMKLDSPDAKVDRDLRTEKKIPNAATPMKTYLLTTTPSYHVIELSPVLKENREIVVQHVASAVRPVSLRECLTSNLSLYRSLAVKNS